MAKKFDKEAFKALGRRAGVPAYEDLDLLRSMPGEDGEINRIVWGSSDAEFEAAVQLEWDRAVAASPHKFMVKYRPGRRKKRQ